MAMETTAAPPTTPPAIVPVFEPLPFGGTVGVGDPVEALAEDVYCTQGVSGRQPETGG
jgi:hypothetical protein